mmetsp:Transcript_18452/g.34203  ORF Transcript_18452/g.34203 Transcript_18452/m.34203 type:complete len:109 (-) Transcript_18452:142-468(-)
MRSFRGCRVMLGWIRGLINLRHIKRNHSILHSILKKNLIMPSGTNSQGNNYNTPGGSNSSGGSSYHYSNSNGSYYYSNDNGSTYHNNGSGSSTYTAPSGHSTSSSQSK